MAGSKGGGGGGKGGSFTPPANQYGGGYGTGYYNPQPRLPQAPYNPMMDVYGSSQNVMQPMMGYYNQFPAAGSNYRPYQPQPQPDPPVYEPTPMPGPGDGPRGGQGGQTGFPIGSEPGTDFNNYNMNDISNAVNRSQFGDYYPVYRDEPQTNSYLNNPYYANHGAAQRSNIPMDNPFSVRDTPATNGKTDGGYDIRVPVGNQFAGNPFNDVYHGSNSFAADPSFYENHNIQYTAPATATGNYNFSTNPQSNNFTPLNSFVANAPTPFLPDVMTAAIPYNRSVPTNNTVDMPILDAADKTGGKRGNTYGIKHSGPAVQNLTPDDNPGFGGYDQNARSIMFTAPTFNFGGYF